MKAICKRSYPYETFDDIITDYQLFIKGKSYEYENTYPKISDKIEEWYFVKNDELDATETFNQIDFETFFISEKELRKIIVVPGQKMYDRVSREARKIF